MGPLVSVNSNQTELFCLALSGLQLSKEQVDGLVQRYAYAIAERDIAIVR